MTPATRPAVRPTFFRPERVELTKVFARVFLAGSEEALRSSEIMPEDQRQGMKRSVREDARFAVRVPRKLIWDFTWVRSLVLLVRNLDFMICWEEG